MGTHIVKIPSMPAITRPAVIPGETPRDGDGVLDMTVGSGADNEDVVVLVVTPPAACTATIR
jgi:hypothetical protein